MHAEATDPMGFRTRSSSTLKPVLILVVVAALATLWFLLPVGAFLQRLAAAIRGAGGTGVLVYVAVYVAATALLVPGTALTVTAGFAWGPWIGLLIVWPTATLSSAVAFAIGRFLARGWVEHKVERHPRMRAIDRAVSESAFRIVLLLRLSPLFPFNLLNYALGLTRMSFGRYVLASFVGMLPGTAMYVYLGSLITTASGLSHPGQSASGAQGVLYWVGLGATVLVTVLITRLARRQLERDVPASDECASASDEDASPSGEQSSASGEEGSPSDARASASHGRHGASDDPIAPTSEPQ